MFGATGFIGRWLVLELGTQGVNTTAVVRSDASAARLLEWLASHGAATLPTVVRADFTQEDLGWHVGWGHDVTEVYNVAGMYAFGMTTQEARAANVDSARRVVDCAATMPHLVRLVHLSGYRVGGQDPASVPWSAQRIAREYGRLGAYEASKAEGDAVVQAAAAASGVPLTVVNPSSVIGHSRTGESPQTLGLGSTVLDLIAGRMPALPAGAETFVPVVTVDYLAAFIALLPGRDDTVGRSYWVLDDDTPPLRDLLRHVGAAHGVKVPRFSVPVTLLRRLPPALTKADPETLSFLSADRYPTGPAHAVAAEHGLRHADVVESLVAWSHYLVSQHGSVR